MGKNVQEVDGNDQGWVGEIRINGSTGRSERKFFRDKQKLRNVEGLAEMWQKLWLGTSSKNK
jgi:hypothetical protein